MDELKVLIEMLAGLPNTILWVLVGYLIYKLVILGSIYGVLRLLIEKAHDWLTRPKVVQWDLEGVTMGMNTKSAIAEQISRLGQRSFGQGYVHFEDVERLRKALDMLLVQERQEAEQKKKASAAKS